MILRTQAGSIEVRKMKRRIEVHLVDPTWPSLEVESGVRVHGGV
jgi:hypothetical protein